MKKIASRKLNLNRERITTLSSVALAEIAGGRKNLSDQGTCGPPSMLYTNCDVCLTEWGCV
jgi:hypothetical protein